MKTRLRFLALSWLALAACSPKSMPSVAGKTNWSVRCSSDLDCGDRTCVCGVCTRECGAALACDGAFTGSCVGTDSASGQLLCNAHETDIPARVCLPRCAADADCGSGFECRKAVCVPDVRPDAGPQPTDAGPDSAAPDTAVPKPTTLEQSRKAWDALEAAMGDTYSYAEENCVVNAPTHKVTTIQVENGNARFVTSTMIARSQCLALVNRYADFQPRTLPELYDECEALVARNGSAVKIELDSRNVVRGCTWSGANGCTDNCGEGFYLRALSFGTLTVP
jgi:hypothetical protein